MANVAFPRFLESGTTPDLTAIKDQIVATLKDTVQATVSNIWYILNSGIEDIQDQETVPPVQSFSLAKSDTPQVSYQQPVDYRLTTAVQNLFNQQPKDRTLQYTPTLPQDKKICSKGHRSPVDSADAVANLLFSRTEQKFMATQEPGIAR